MTVQMNFRATDAFRSAIPMHPIQQNRSADLGELAVCRWHTPWIKGFELPANDDLVIALHSNGQQCDVRAINENAVSKTRSVPGAITCIPPERDHRFKVEGEVGFHTIHIPRRRLQGLPGQPSLTAIPDFRFAFHDAFLGACVDALLGESRKPGPKSDEFIHCVTTSMLIHLLRASPPAFGDPARSAGRPSSPIERSRQLIDANLDRGLTLEDLADAAGISRSHFARLFRAEVGVSPHRYQSQQRVNVAKRLLRETSMGLVDISMELGFCSQSHFTQVFHSHVGMPPRKYRDSAQLVATAD